MKKRNFEKLAQEWKNRKKRENYYADIYDGKIWEENLHFLSKDNHFGLMLNVDWFQPFSSKTYSVGVIYATIMNLPREERFKKENVLILGIIPGPEEPDVIFFFFFFFFFFFNVFQ